MNSIDNKIDNRMHDHWKMIWSDLYIVEGMLYTKCIIEHQVTLTYQSCYPAHLKYII